MLENKTNCEHQDYCGMIKFGRINCIDKYSCETYKAYQDCVHLPFVNKEEMFVGSIDKQTIDKLFREDMRDY